MNLWTFFFQIWRTSDYKTIEINVTLYLVYTKFHEIPSQNSQMNYQTRTSVQIFPVLKKKKKSTQLELFSVIQNRTTFQAHGWTWAHMWVCLPPVSRKSFLTWSVLDSMHSPKCLHTIPWLELVWSTCLSLKTATNQDHRKQTDSSKSGLHPSPNVTITDSCRITEQLVTNCYFYKMFFKLFFLFCL